MNHGQQAYLRQCYTNHKESLGTCKRCGPPRAPIQKRWADAVLDVVDYVNAIAPAAPEFVASKRTPGYPATDIASWHPHGTYGAGIFEADNYDSGTRGWYWRIPSEGNMSEVHHTDNPVDALIGCVNAYEKDIGADGSAPLLVFTVRLRHCKDDGHEWKSTGMGRHGSDKGVYHSECIHCDATKEE